jgi:hypothetical protein
MTLICAFVRSLADQDSDRWIFEVLAPDIRRKMKNTNTQYHWTDLVYCAAEITHQDIFFSDSCLTAPRVFANCINEVVPERTSKEHCESCPSQVHLRFFSSTRALNPFSSASRDDPWRQNPKGSDEPTNDIPLSLERQLCLHLNDFGST